MSSANDDLSKQVESWITQDPDMKTRDQLIELLTAHQSGESESSAELSNLFSGRLAFGTAGIRGPIRPGPSGMNRVVIGQTTAGLARYLLQNRDPSASHRLLVVVGCDARTNSDVFASDTASILSGHGIDVIQLPDALPTPVLAFAVRHFGADAGVMVTASHNPPEDNGYKVYLGGVDEGSQIIPQSTLRSKPTFSMSPVRCPGVKSRVHLTTSLALPNRLSPTTSRARLPLSGSLA